MPGVPSSRGCDACRKQKKKCDQSRPSCSRCTRLQIPCVGCGQQRYKFQQQTAAALRPAQGRQVARLPTSPTVGVPRAPSNETSAVVSAFVSILEVKDVRFNISCFGGFLYGIPKRIGQNSALDASVVAITASFPSMYSNQQGPEALAAYGKALTALRVSLVDPVKSCTVETLCAVYLVMLCQGWLGSADDPHMSHGEALAYLLQTAASKQHNSSFEAETLFTLCLPVIVESAINPKIQLDPWLWKITRTFETYGPARPLDRGSHFLPSLDCLKYQFLAQMPKFVQNPERNHSQIRSSYQQTLTEIFAMRNRLGSTTPIMMLDTRYQTGYGSLLSLAMFLNSILLAFHPYDASLTEESATMRSEIMTLAWQALDRRPLGAGYIPVCLISAWVAANDIVEQTEIEDMLLTYGSGFMEKMWLKRGIAFKGKLKRLRLKVVTHNIHNLHDGEGYADGDFASDTTEKIMEDIGDPCCIL